VLSQTKKSITIPPGEVAVGTDGALSVGGAVFASLGLFGFSDGSQLKAEGANRYVAVDGAVPSQSRTSSIHQGQLEGANEDVIQGSLDLLMMGPIPLELAVAAKAIAHWLTTARS